MRAYICSNRNSVMCNSNKNMTFQILSVGNVNPPQITYEYTVPKKILNSYTWLLSNWSICNRMCQGMTYRKVECRSTEHKDIVPDDYCRVEEKPREESKMCNAHCTLQ
jgi:thrombospondin motif-containing protein 9